MNEFPDEQVVEPTSYVVKVRGRLYGPYPMSKLQELARRAALSRINQVSVDGGASWQPASDYPEIFEIPVEEGDNGVSVTPENEGEWRYLLGGKEYGPTSLQQLQLMVHAGTLSRSDFVYRDGEEDWSRIDTVPELLSLLSKDEEQKEEGISKRVRNAFRESRPWSLCLGILGLHYSGVLLLGGIWILALGSGTRNGALVGMGCMNIVSAIILGTGAFLIIRHSNKVRRLSSEKSEKRLVAMAESLTGFWMYSSIVAICYLIFLVTLFILAMVGQLAFLFRTAPLLG